MFNYLKNPGLYFYNQGLTKTLVLLNPGSQKFCDLGLEM